VQTAHLLQQIREATGRLVMSARSLNEHDVAAPSLCSGWTRGHVLAHVALNADSLVNLLTWARTGIETPQYPSWEVRESDIGEAAGRSVGGHLDAITASAARFESAAESLPGDRWSYVVRGIGGDAQPASEYLTARRREVEVHHVDLDAGYGPERWPLDFVESELVHAASKLSRRAVTSFNISVTDLGSSLLVGTGSASGNVKGPGYSLLAWLYGRGSGSDLQTDLETLPELGAWG